MYFSSDSNVLLHLLHTTGSVRSFFDAISLSSLTSLRFSGSVINLTTYLRNIYLYFTIVWISVFLPNNCLNVAFPASIAWAGDKSLIQVAIDQRCPNGSLM